MAPESPSTRPIAAEYLDHKHLRAFGRIAALPHEEMFELTDREAVSPTE